MNLIKKEKLGEGSYGIVYKGQSNSGNFAIKRNFKDNTADWCSNLRELSMLSRLKNHPLFVSLVDVSFGEPFSEGPLTPIGHLKNGKERDNVLDDEIHFILNLENTTCAKFIKKCTLSERILVMAQILLAIEYIHAHGICHRDLKPQNILISNDEDGLPVAKIADFGMAQYLTSSVPSTLGISTIWYRSPEIAIGDSNYSCSSDIWAVGCILYEMFSKKPLMSGVRDKNTEVLNTIISYLPEEPSRSLISKYQSKNSKLKCPKKKDRIPYVERMKLQSNFRNEMLEYDPDFLINLEDLLKKTLNFNYKTRIEASEALNHPFFKKLNSYISKFRQTYVPRMVLPTPQIKACQERKFVTNLSKTLLNSEELEWANYRLIFHAIDTFDRYLHYHKTILGEINYLEETNKNGFLHTKKESIFIFFLICYMWHKYYSAMTFVIPWNDFAPEIYQSEKYREKARNLEEHILTDIVDYDIYRDSLLETADFIKGQSLTEEELSNLFLKYCEVQSWNKSIRRLYNHLKNS